MSLSKKMLAEGIATFTLVFIGAGSICANAFSNNALGLTGIAFAHGLAIMVMVYVTAHISGAHINPAVSFAMFLTRRLSFGEWLGYVASQLLGGIIAAFALKMIWVDMVSAPPYLGNPELTTALLTFTPWHGVAVEAILTFLLVFTIFAAAVDERCQKPAIGLAIGLVIFIDICMGGVLTGAAMNPARAFGTALATGRWAHQFIYWLGPLVGGGLAGVWYDRVYLRK